MWRKSIGRTCSSSVGIIANVTWSQAAHIAFQSERAGTPNRLETLMASPERSDVTDGISGNQNVGRSNSHKE